MLIDQIRRKLEMKNTEIQWADAIFYPWIGRHLKPPYGLSMKQWAAIQNAALNIDPKAAICEVHCAFHGDPYWANKDLPDECKCNCPNDYVWLPESDILVCFDDLPERTRVALYRRLEEEAAEARRSADSDDIVEEIYEI
jgi:hypothetical protein